MDDAGFRLLFFSLVNGGLFGFAFLFGRKAHPRPALWLSLGSFVVMMVLCSLNGAWLLLSLVTGLFYLFVLKKPDQSSAFARLYKENKIFTAANTSRAALEVLGNKNWRFAEGSLVKADGEILCYGFWQGTTSSSVSTGKYGTTTVYSYYLAFVFPAGSVSSVFKQHVIAAANRSQRSFWQRLKFFFTPDTETPNFVSTAKDGSFVVQYDTKPDPEYYRRRLNWIKTASAIPFTLQLNSDSGIIK